MASFTFLTWNIAMMERSDFAPAEWRMDQTEAAIRAVVLNLSPDFVMFQELPGMVPFVETHGMVPANTKGQSGDIATLAKHDLLADIEAAVAPHAVLATVKSAGLTLANVHLPSSKGADHDRLAACIKIKGEAAEHLAIIGDTNLRTAEEDALAANGLLGARPPQPTWNGRINPFRHGARAFTAYFTRALHTEGVGLSEQRVLTEPVTHKGEAFYLSDHFALFGRISVNP